MYSKVQQAYLPNKAVSRPPRVESDSTRAPARTAWATVRLSWWYMDVSRWQGDEVQHREAG